MMVQSPQHFSRLSKLVKLNRRSLWRVPKKSFIHTTLYKFSYQHFWNWMKRGRKVCSVTKISWNWKRVGRLECRVDETLLFLSSYNNLAFSVLLALGNWAGRVLWGWNSYSLFIVMIIPYSLSFTHRLGNWVCRVSCGWNFSFLFPRNSSTSLSFMWLWQLSTRSVVRIKISFLVIMILPIRFQRIFEFEDVELCLMWRWNFFLSLCNDHALFSHDLSN
jgi:hypothetical protein